MIDEHNCTPWRSKPTAEWMWLVVSSRAREGHVRKTASPSQAGASLERSRSRISRELEDMVSPRRQLHVDSRADQSIAVAIELRGMKPIL